MTWDALGWYGSIFFWMLFTGIGIPPVPEEAGILYAASVHALHPDVLWPFAWAACGLGILGADCILYGIGRRWGPRLFEYRWVQKFLKAEKRQRLEKRVHEHGIKLLVLARFLPPIRTGVFMIAGASKFPFVKFVLADLVYCVFGVGLFFFAGTWIIAQVHEIQRRFGNKAIWFAAVPVVLFALYKYFRYLQRREAGPVAPVSILQSPAGSVPEGETAVNPAGAAPAIHEAKAALEEE